MEMGPSRLKSRQMSPTEEAEHQKVQEDKARRIHELEKAYPQLASRRREGTLKLGSYAPDHWPSQGHPSPPRKMTQVQTEDDAKRERLRAVEEKHPVLSHLRKEGTLRLGSYAPKGEMSPQRQKTQVQTEDDAKRERLRAVEEKHPVLSHLRKEGTLKLGSYAPKGEMSPQRQKSKAGSGPSRRLPTLKE